MRQRRQGEPVAKEAPKVKKEGALGQTYAASRKRGFYIATAFFVVFLFFVFGMKWSIKDEVFFSEQDIARLDVAVKRVEQEVAISKLEELVDTVVPLSCALQKVLSKFMDAANEGNEQKLKHLEKQYQFLPNLMKNVARAGDALYTQLKGMLLQDPNMPLLGVPRYLPRTFFRYMAATTYIQSVVLPDYHLHRSESTTDHIRALVRARNLLQWTENIKNENFFNWTGSVCYKAFDGMTSNHWVKFCDTSLTSPAATQVRVAAVLEELIALDSSYAPFRAHYVATLSFLGTPKMDRAVVLSAIRKQKENIAKGQYKHTEPFYAPLLDVLEAFVIPLDMADYQLVQRAEQSMKRFPNCSVLREPFLYQNTSVVWPGKKTLKESRAPLMQHHQVDTLIDKLSLVFSDDQRSILEAFKNCTV